MNGSVRLSVCPSVRHSFLTMFPSSYHHENVTSYYHWQKWRPCKRPWSEVKFQGHTAKKNRRFWPKLGISGLQLQFEFRYDDEMMQRVWWCLREVLYYFSRSSVKYQSHTALKIVEFDPNWAFPDCNSSLNSPMATKCCTKREVA